MTKDLWPGNDARLLELLDLGSSWSVIARDLGISESAVRRRAKRLGRDRSALAGKHTVVQPPKPAHERARGQLRNPISTLPPLPSLTLPFPGKPDRK